MRRSAPLALLALLLLALPAVADAAKKRTIDRSRHLWATVNACDTERRPDRFGVRASMPGSGERRERMYMRFRAQYLSDERDDDGDRWHDFTADGLDSGWVRVGSARYRRRESGWWFPRFALEAGERYELRAVVRFEWRRGKKVVRRAVKRTRSGKRPQVADPKGYSKATCVLAG